MREIQTVEGRAVLNGAHTGKVAPPGPWWDEPDRVEWMHPTGVECRAIRGPFGAWCGYAGVPKGHPLYGADYTGLSAEVHGGLTYAGELRGSTSWWLGFDCAHAGDVTPSNLAHGFPSYPGEEYRPLTYVIEQVEQLARWMAERGWPDTDDPNAPCLACGHVLISHRPPVLECLAYNRTGDEWHGCPCERFILDREASRG